MTATIRYSTAVVLALAMAVATMALPTYANVNNQNNCEVVVTEVVSDTTNIIASGPNVGNNAVEVAVVHAAWTASIPGATWIWDEEPQNEDSTVDRTTGFTKSFNVPGTVQSATLDIAADNSYEVFLGGSSVAADPTEFNFNAAGQDDYNLTSDVHSGLNTLLIEVKNHAGVANQLSNPGGLLYKLVIESEVCEEPEQPQTIGDDRVRNSNHAVVINETDADANTGDNWAGGSEGGDGGNGGDVENENGGDAEDNTTGNGGNGGSGSEGGVVQTGNAGAGAGTVNVVNSNVTRVDRCACNGGDDEGDVSVRNRNGAFLYNETDADADTGDNAASGSEGGEGGNGGDVESEDGEGDTDGNTTGDGGAGGRGGLGGMIVTGDAEAVSGTLNVVNRNRTTIRR